MNLKIAAILVAAGGALLAPLAAAQSDQGETLFRQKCATCHSVAPGGAPGPLAPNLRGVVGRKAGSANFAGYSPAIKGSGLVWTQANLDRFVADPQQVVRGTKMVIRVTDPAQRKAIIAYLSRQR